MSKLRTLIGVGVAVSVTALTVATYPAQATEPTGRIGVHTSTATDTALSPGKLQAAASVSPDGVNAQVIPWSQSGPGR